jgi:hypothetical protein
MGDDAIGLDTRSPAPEDWRAVLWKVSHMHREKGSLENTPTMPDAWLQAMACKELSWHVGRTCL